MNIDDLFAINKPDGYIENSNTVGRLGAYICRICGAFVARNYLVAHTDIHNKMEEIENTVRVLRATNKDYGAW